MDINETLSDGLKRELKVTVPAGELNDRLAARLDQLRGQVRLKGFRPGKVPTEHLRRLYGKAAMAEIVENIVAETTRTAINERGEKAAMQPEIAMTDDEAEANEILAANADLTFTVNYEVLPEFEIAEIKGIKIERPIAEVPDEEVEERLNAIGEGSRTYEAMKRKAKDGDRITIGFVGKIDGEVFDGGSDDNTQIVIGSGQFIPGFEEKLKGVKEGEEKTIEVTFPEDYPSEKLAGKPATFDVKVKEVAAPQELKLDDEFAQKLGVESLDKLKEAVRAQLESEYGSATRQRVKRQLLDALDEKHEFPLPEKLVEQEFENIWRQVMHDVEHHGRSFEDEGTTEEEARAEYRTIAERRVRLGLVLSKIGEEAKVEVGEEELQRALYEQVRRFPGQEQQVIEHYRNNPDAVQALRAPIFEEKVVDYMLELADVTDKTVSREELLADDDEDDHDHHHHHDHDH
ncbi:trigger factor [Afifella marina]|uniref:Trigger factor n=1 Tax=Afifella marina DSM 2698 TaxID=1120955 RepID=A0A1G5NK50_AFIMA|nr:trigger factor [Afifella marina]MBK1623707.1 trigger factor [Afifella marina DSM 2698]MBK1626700.1 trigger factor [Afifella marina]MBK5916249.1 trigger factor [Afifella marina]RAI21561.1 trigger factor [Afifella marina DSM 2698]SCZ37776.1 trigger factor [Afifella marina DSM 2698]